METLEIIRETLKVTKRAFNLSMIIGKGFFILHPFIATSICSVDIVNPYLKVCSVWK